MACKLVERLWSAAVTLMLTFSSAATQAQEAGFDLLSFDCANIVRREGSMLEVGYGRRPYVFTCKGPSCVHRNLTIDDDGNASEFLWYVFFPEDGQDFISTRLFWQSDDETPSRHQSRIATLKDCFSITADPERWIIDRGTVAYEGVEIHATPRSGDYRADYLYAPTRLLGDWSEASAIVFEKRSFGGQYLPAYHEDIYGDIVLRNGPMRASFEIPKHHTGEWRTFRVPLNDPGWRLEGGATSLEDILGNITRFQIRAEYGHGGVTDISAFRNIVVE